MRIKIVGLFLIGIILLSCQKDEIDDHSLLDSDGLSLYWDHKIFGEAGRRYVFEFYEAQRFENLYELKFEYDINNTQMNIDIYLTDKVDKGKCPVFPSPNITDDLCISKGGFSISEEMLIDGNYTFTIRTSSFEIQSNFTIKKDKVTLNIPKNKYFSSSIMDVFPTPRDLLYGSVLFTGEENADSANEFFEKLETLGLNDTIVSNSPFNLNVDEIGKPEDRHWPPDNHSFAFLYSMNVSFQTILELSKKHFNKYDLNIYLFSSNGDQARLSKNDGIIVIYAN